MDTAVHMDTSFEYNITVGNNRNQRKTKHQNMPQETVLKEKIVKSRTGNSLKRTREGGRK